jgi:hypothetical protein
MINILITGGTGLIGKYLVRELQGLNYNVFVLTSDKNKTNDFTSYWNYNHRVLDKEIIKKADHIIHLAGANIASGRWTEKRKKIIVESRTESTSFLFEMVKELNPNLKSFISASAVGYYGAKTSDVIFNEDSAPANDFLGNTCLSWEESANKFENIGIRTVKLRTGIVLSDKGGALEKMIPSVKLGLGSAIGTGKQYMPWIHIDDLCKIYIRSIENIEMNGAYNAVAPNHINNKQFFKLIAQSLGKPFWMPNIPSVIFKLMFGEMSEILLTGTKISSDKIINSGFKFKFTNLDAALKSLSL